MFLFLQLSLCRTVAVWTPQHDDVALRTAPSRIFLVNNFLNSEPWQNLLCHSRGTNESVSQLPATLPPNIFDSPSKERYDCIWAASVIDHCCHGQETFLGSTTRHLFGVRCRTLFVRTNCRQNKTIDNKHVDT